MLVLRGAPPAQGGMQVLGALVGHVSVIMQRQFQQFVGFIVPSVQFLDRMVDLGTHSAHCAADRGLSQVQFFMVVDAPVVVQ